MRVGFAVLPFVVAFAHALPKNIASCGSGLWCPEKLDDKGDDMCKLNVTEDSEGNAVAVWKITQADKYLDKVLDDGIKGWTTHMFNDAGIKESYCGELNFNKCNVGDCSDYDPKEAFFIHQSISNLNSAFEKMHEDLQDKAIESLAKGVSDIVDTFGDVDTTSDVFSILIGATVAGSGLAGPAWKVGAPLTFLVGMLNIASGVYSSKDYEGELEDKLGKMFGDFSDSLKTATKALPGRL